MAAVCHFGICKILTFRHTFIAGSPEKNTKPRQKSNVRFTQHSSFTCTWRCLTETERERERERESWCALYPRSFRPSPLWCASMWWSGGPLAPTCWSRSTRCETASADRRSVSVRDDSSQKSQGKLLDLGRYQRPNLTSFDSFVRWLGRAYRGRNLLVIIIIIIIIIRAFARRTMSASELNLRRRCTRTPGCPFFRRQWLIGVQAEVELGWYDGSWIWRKYSVIY